MGAWGPGIFENDETLDWVDELVKTKNTCLIEETLHSALSAHYLDQDVASCALAAAAVIAAVKDANYSQLPDDVVEWVQKHKITDTGIIVQLALESIQRVKTDSELRDLWIESGNEMEWYMTVDGFLDRLNR